MTKSVRMTVALAFILGSLAACGGDGGADDPTSPPSSDTTLDWDEDNWDEENWG